jgi:competence protein ComEA
MRDPLAGTALAGALAIAFSMTGGMTGHAQDQLPDAPGKDQVVNVCGKCHEPQRVAALRLTREGWEEVIAKMVSLGAKASDDDLKQITDYLAENFKGEAAKPINLNTASSVDLESVAGLLRKEAAAWIAYRAKNGPCKALDDLKKVPGVPFKKIDERRDRLVCVVLGTGSGVQVAGRKEEELQGRVTQPETCTLSPGTSQPVTCMR